MHRPHGYDTAAKAPGRRYRPLFTCVPGQGTRELLTSLKKGLIPLSFGGVLMQVGMRLALKK